MLGVPRGQLPLVGSVAGGPLGRFRELVARRADRVPLQHLTGAAYFRHLTLAVGPGVFVPRPETEAVVGWVIETLAAARATPEAAAGPAGGPVCVDLCAGSGAIALALADEVRGAEVHAVEADPAALDYLRRNVAATGLPVQVHAADALGFPPIGAGPGPGPPLLDDPELALPPAEGGGGGPVLPRGDGEPRSVTSGYDATAVAATMGCGWASTPVLAALAGLCGRVDVVVSNPPYLPDTDRALVEPEVGDHDPPWALWGGGGDGLAGPRAVSLVAAALLRPGGLFAMEHADGQGDATRALLAEAGGWGEIATRHDLAGRDRFVTARRRESPDRADEAVRATQ